jgi:hypothetical protein
MTKEDLRAVVDLIADLKQERDTSTELREKAHDLLIKSQQREGALIDELGRAKDRIRELEVQTGYDPRCKSQRGTGGGFEQCILVEGHSCDHKFPSDNAIQAGQTYCGCWSDGGRCSLPHGHTGPHA